MRMVLYNLAQVEQRETAKDTSFSRLVADIHLAGKLFEPQQRCSEDEEDEVEVEVEVEVEGGERKQEQDVQQLTKESLHKSVNVCY